MKTIKPIFLVATLFAAQVSVAQFGALDSSFDSDGKVSTSFDQYNSAINSIAIQSDGKIVAAGAVYNQEYNQMALARYNSDGSLDPGFGIGGKVISTFSDSKMALNSIVLQPDGKIIGTGIIYNNFTDSQFVIVRYNNNGSLDTGFGVDGTVIGDAVRINALALQSNGKIIVAGFTVEESGNRDFFVSRYLDDGTLDVDFGMDGIMTTPIGERDLAFSMALQPDGKIVLAGNTSTIGYTSDFAIVRYLNGGTIDLAFGTNGVVVIDGDQNDTANAVRVQSDGKIVFAGYSSPADVSLSGFVLARLLDNGNPDLDFGIAGVVGGPGFGLANALTIQTDGKILIAGAFENGPSYNDIAVSRFQTNGVWDPTFGTGGMVTTAFSTTCKGNSIVLQADSKIVVGGEAGTTGGTYSPDFAVLRYTSGCELATSAFNFVQQKFTVYPIPANQTVNLDFNLNQSEVLSVDLYNSDGRKISCLISGQGFQIGYHSLGLELPETLASGIYFLKVSNGNDNTSIKIVK